MNSTYSVYKLSTRNKIVILIFSSVMMGIGLFIMLMPFIKNRANEIDFVLLTLIFAGPVFFMAMCSFLGVLTNRKRIELLDDRIRIVKLFKTYELNYKNIQGFRIISGPYGCSKILVLLSKDSKKNISEEMLFEREDELLKWVSENFIDITKNEFYKELYEIIENKDSKNTQSERFELFKKSVRWSEILAYLVFPTALLNIFLPSPYNKITAVLLLILPLVSISFLKIFSGIIKFDGREGGAYPTIGIEFIVSCVGISVYSLFEWNILSWSSFWLPFFILTIILYGTILIFDSEIKKGLLTSLIVLVCCLGYGYGATLAINGIFDASLPSVSQSYVISKRVSQGKTPTFYLTISPGPKKIQEEIKVQESIYNTTNVGARVKVYINSGLLKIPFYYVK